MMETMYFSLPTLPWDKSSEDERNFRVIMGAALILFVFLAVGVRLVQLPVKQREQVEAVPPRMARLITELHLPPPPPPVEKPKLQPEPPKPEETKPEPKAEEPPKPVEKPKPIEKPKPVEVKKEPTVTIKPVEDAREVRKTVAKKEAAKAAAVFDSLSDLRNDSPASAVASLTASPQQAIGPGAPGVGDGPAGPTSRNLVGKLAAGGSGGVQVARASAGGGGAGTAGGTGKLRATQATAMSSAINAQVADPVRQEGGQSGPSGKARRTIAQIQMIFDRYKGQINALYQRALREDPGLEGTLLIKLDIAPDGSVTSCSVVSSELAKPDLERKILIKVKQLNFGGGNVEPWSGNFPIKFFPS